MNGTPPFRSGQSVVPYDENLLERARTQWHFGDWESLARLERDTLQHHPDRAKLALLAAAGRLHTSRLVEAKQYLHLARDWGVSDTLISRTLIAGVHNTLGRVAMLLDRQNAALKHFSNAIAVGASSTDINLITQARIHTQAKQLGFCDHLTEKPNRIESRIRFIDSLIHSFQSEKQQLEKQKRSTYYTPRGYDAKRYWKDRHAQYGFSLQGVGNKGLTDAQNRQMYVDASQTFVSLCRRLTVNPSTAKVLDIGCGTGYYAGVLKQLGVVHYRGVDITASLFPELSRRYPAYEFIEADISQEEIDGVFDLILMIDVTQHIVEDDKFSFAMHNVRRCLSENGVFIVTSWLQRGLKNSFYELSRGVEEYEREFVGWRFSQPLPFRDKFIFSIRRS